MNKHQRGFLWRQISCTLIPLLQVNGSSSKDVCPLHSSFYTLFFFSAYYAGTDFYFYFSFCTTNKGINHSLNTIVVLAVKLSGSIGCRFGPLPPQMCF